jgi:hypothetical protein
MVFVVKLPTHITIIARTKLSSKLRILIWDSSFGKCTRDREAECSENENELSCNCLQFYIRKTELLSKLVMHREVLQGGQVPLLLGMGEN